MALTLHRAAGGAVAAIAQQEPVAIFRGDCLNLLQELPNGSVDLVVTSPPYCMGKEYERSTSVDDFIDAHKVLLPEVARVTKLGGSICWQVGYHVSNNRTYPLDFAVFEIMRSLKDISLRNRIIWTFSHGLHGTKRFSGRHEIVMWFVKGDSPKFDLDAVRVMQKYPGKRHYKGPKKGELSGNPLGKNPGDVWDIPNVKGNHIEKSAHPCQFPVALVQRLVRGLTSPGDLVLDPFCGAGSSGVAAIVEGRRFLGAEIDSDYAKIARDKLSKAINGKAQFRPLEQPIYVPSENSAVARKPDHFIGASSHGSF